LRMVFHDMRDDAALDRVTQDFATEAVFRRAAHAPSFPQITQYVALTNQKESNIQA
jgi:hypothetical protein